MWFEQQRSLLTERLNRQKFHPEWALRGQNLPPKLPPGRARSATTLGLGSEAPTPLGCFRYPEGPYVHFLERA